jgi:oxygen-independent coproporphyrinogen-3 oxidase
MFGIYVHIPFCHHRCSYCDFNIYAGMKSLYTSYVEAAMAEIAAAALRAGRVRVPSIYLGGGTPSLLPPKLIGRLLSAVRTDFNVEEEAEITLEANPQEAKGLGRDAGGRGQEAYFAELRSLGVNRLSLGLQSSHEDELHLLRRGHSFAEAVATYKAARQAGFQNVNVDLIYGLPNQPIDKWRATLERVIALQPDHLSAYSLQIEPRTAMLRWVQNGRLPEPDDDTGAAMYEWTQDRLAQAGFEHYEISNWAKHLEPASAGFPYQASNSCDAPAHDASRGTREAGNAGLARHCEERSHLPPIDTEIASQEAFAMTTFTMSSYASRHNLIYWRNEPYLGFGCGAHSSFGGKRYSNVLHPREYIERLQRTGEAVAETEDIDRSLEIGETMMLGLRLITEGVRRARFKDRFGVELDEVYGATIAQLVEQGLLESDAGRIRLTAQGRLLGNRVFAEFLP